MKEIERKKLITDVVKYGGIGLRRQTLRVHKNGAKFPISKNYIDDEILDAKKTYTIILIPEIKIATDTSIILSFFTRRDDPLIFYSFPEGALNISEKLNIIKNIDQTFKKEFYIQESSFIPSSIHFYFEIPSEWARGKKEQLLLSIILNKPITPILEETLRPICKDFAIQLKNDENTFKGLYINHMDRVSEKDQQEIKIYSNGLRERIKKLYIQIIQILQS